MTCFTSLQLPTNAAKLLQLRNEHHAVVGEDFGAQSPEPEKTRLRGAVELRNNSDASGLARRVPGGAWRWTRQRKKALREVANNLAVQLLNDSEGRPSPFTPFFDGSPDGTRLFTRRAAAHVLAAKLAQSFPGCWALRVKLEVERTGAGPITEVPNFREPIGSRSGLKYVQDKHRPRVRRFPEAEARARASWARQICDGMPWYPAQDVPAPGRGKASEWPAGAEQLFNPSLAAGSWRSAPDVEHAESVVRHALRAVHPTESKLIPAEIIKELFKARRQRVTDEKLRSTRGPRPGR